LNLQKNINEAITSWRCLWWRQKPYSAAFKSA